MGRSTASGGVRGHQQVGVLPLIAFWQDLVLRLLQATEPTEKARVELGQEAAQQAWQEDPPWKPPWGVPRSRWDQVVKQRFDVTTTRAVRDRTRRMERLGLVERRERGRTVAIQEPLDLSPVPVPPLKSERLWEVWPADGTGEPLDGVPVGAARHLIQLNLGQEASQREVDRVLDEMEREGLADRVGDGSRQFVAWKDGARAYLADLAQDRR